MQHTIINSHVEFEFVIYSRDAFPTLVVLTNSILHLSTESPHALVCSNNGETALLIDRTALIARVSIRSCLWQAGFIVDDIALVPRPTLLPAGTGMRGWLATFTRSFLNAVPPEENSDGPSQGPCTRDHLLFSCNGVIRPAQPQCRVSGQYSRPSRGFFQTSMPLLRTHLSLHVVLVVTSLRFALGYLPRPP